ncbi:allantoinase AllB [Candidatus Formimonas warabiya]|uniref:allantoinase n=1 Tax=Formimonas warabiya TaxID=1761012 RepID=A0A3G1KXJ7_FORW1|nr:allantoinase AllB [Candidatus Formimonas warabiya]ATW27162.1 allantoinase [Candidatus Formimonas warabiya]
MKVDLLIKNGKVVTPEATYDAAVAISGGKFVGLISGKELPEADEVYDASGKYVLPGLIDCHVHFREPGVTYKEDFQTGSLAAACGGITTVVDMPNVNPATSTVEAFNLKLDAAEDHSYVDFGIYAVILQENINDLIPLRDAGVVGYKIFLGATVGNIPAPDDGMMYDAMKVVASTGLRIGFHAENNEIINHRVKQYKGQGIMDPKIWAEARPAVAEADAIAKLIRFSEYTGVKVHIYHMSSKEGVELVRAAKEKGIDITAESGPHYLLTDVSLSDKVGSMLKMNPPVRYKEDSEKLWEGLNDGTVEAIATDHSPHTMEEKDKNIWDAIPGFCGVETSVPLMLTAVNEGRMTLNQYVKVASEGPAKIWNMYPQKGSLNIGTDADLTIVDMERTGEIKAEELHSKNKVTPFDGFKVKGMPVCTIVRGKFVMKDSEIVGKPGHGTIVKPAK